jgi:serine protease Do
MNQSSPWFARALFVIIGVAGGICASRELIGQPPLPLPGAPGNQPVLPRDWMSFSPVVKRVLPGVVCIEGKGKASRANLEDPDPGFGSGFIVDASGIVVTNNHVVRETSAVDVTLQDGRKFSSTDIRRDPKTDIAIIKLESKEQLPFVEFGDSDAMEVGDQVLAVGAPFGLKSSVTSGIVSGKSRNNLNLNLYEDFLQIDAAVNPGNSGGPLISMEGKVVGLTAAIKTRTGGFQGVGLAVSSKIARTIVDQLSKNGFVKRPSIGVSVVELDEASAAAAKLKANTGVIVSKVLKDSPAGKANLGIGDIITSLNGQNVNTVREMQKTVLSLPVGQEVEMRVVRKGVLFQTHVTAEDLPDRSGELTEATPSQPLKYDSLGLGVTDLTADTAAKLGLPKTAQGVLITSVTPGSLAQQSGLSNGMIILQVDKTPVTSADGFRKAIEQASKDKGAVLQVAKPNGDVDFVILRGQ